MKKKIYFSILAIGFAITLLSYSSGTPGGKTGSTLDVNTCTQCHSGTAISQENWITSNIPASGYVPGETYTITATGTHSGAAKFGFEITSEDASSKVGTFIVTDAATTKLANGNNAIGHTSSNSASSGSKTWSFDWTAPLTGTGDVTFFGAFNAANDNGSTSGDVIYTSQMAVSEASVGVNDKSSVELTIFPNPVEDFLSIKSESKIQNIKIIDLIGKLVFNKSGIDNTSEKINLNILSAGTYLILIKGENFLKKEKIIIKK